jgi:hypothetical protein
MKFTGVALLMSLPLSPGCGALNHGPAMEVISNETRADHVQVNENGGINRVLMTESRLRDEKGREWTESAVVGIERVPDGLPKIEAELFEEAMRASEKRSE